MRDEFLITRQGKQYVLFAGLLDEAHTLGLKEIDTDLIQVPNPANDDTAIVKATVVMDDERRFSGIGDASPHNVGRNIAPHLIRMAETRAKARALRDAVNVGVTALEEIDDSEPQEERAGRQRAPQGRQGQGQGDNVHDLRGGAAQSEQRGPRGDQRARKSQVDMLTTLATEWAGEGGVERLQGRLGKPLAELTKSEADEWIDKLTPEGREPGETAR